LAQAIHSPIKWSTACVANLNVTSDRTNIGTLLRSRIDYQRFHTLIYRFDEFIVN